MTKYFLILLVMIFAIACKDKKPPPIQPEPTVESTPTPEPPNPVNVIKLTKTVSAAVNVAKPFMAHVTDGEVNPGTLLFAVWADEHLTWQELAAMPEARQAVVMKDPPASYGQKLCAPGVVFEIRKDGDFWVGGITNGGFHQIVRFVGIKSSGDIVQNSSAKFCGIITGTESYSNSGGGTTHAVNVVGMFDLPENR